MMQRQTHERAITRHQQAIQWITVFGQDAATHQPTHQHRNEGDGQAGGNRHGIGLGVGQRREQPPFLGFESEHGQEAEGDDQQRKEQRGSHLAGGLLDDTPMVGVIARPSLFQMFVQVLDHDNGGIDHGADGDGDAAQ